jgi:hypothetical protein
MLWPIFIISVLCGFAGSGERIANSPLHLLMATLAALVAHELASS